MLYSVTSEKPVGQLREDLTKACAAHKFGVMAVHDLREKLREKGVEYGRECLIFEVCNPQKAKQALEANPEISSALPCRISIFKTAEGTTKLSTLRPRKLLEVFGSKELKTLAAEIEQTMIAILEEAAN